MAAFVWKVATKGYMWLDQYTIPAGKFGPGWFTGCVGNVLVPVEWEFSTYQPLKEHSGLFRDFASTPPTPEGIQAFANKFGHLGEGGGVMTWGPSKGVDFDTDEERRQHENDMEWLSVPQMFVDWKDTILRMRKAVDLWDRVGPSKVDAKAVKALQEIVDEQLSELRIVARFEIATAPPRQPALHLVPTTLGGAMWLQLAQAIAGNKKYRACEACGRNFELSPEVARTSRHYCSEACRSRAYRARKERARTLTAEGKTPKQIAAELGSDVKTINEWLRQKKEH